jgi:hypothetical protein
LAAAHACLRQTGGVIATRRIRHQICEGLMPLPRCFKTLSAPVLAAAVLSVSAAGAAAAELAPHRAVYDLSLAKARSSQAATAVDGRMAFVWKDVCDGWTIEYDTEMDLVFSKRGSRSVAWQYTAWESDDASRLRFFLQRYMNGEPTLHRRGRAEKGPEGGVAVITKPEEREVELAPGTLFPGEHSRKLLDAARNGERFFYAEVFDGTGENDGLFAANAAILDRRSDVAPPLDSPLLRGVASWRVNMAFYGPGESSGAPQSEQNVRYYENGVVTDLELDYGDFVVEARLTDLKALERPDCG